MADYASLLRKHVTLKYRSLDRIFLQAYVPKLQSVGQVCIFLRWERGYKIPSSAVFGQIGREFVSGIEQFAKEHGVPVVRFEKDQCKEEVARPYLEKAAQEGKEQVVLIGIAQEKASAWRSFKAKSQRNAAHPHMEWSRQMVYVNHYYFYIWDSDWGAVFWKTNAYAPYPIWHWTTAFGVVRMSRPCRRSAMGWVRGRYETCSGVGFTDFPLLSSNRICRPVTSTSWLSASWRSR
ncbi:hypothetical protein MYX78_11500, partial [Acidobacteria bacterium AH-259-G07]|nr:hypothetical protein [Acidobacteria bacterium AH-259-G07]